MKNVSVCTEKGINVDKKVVHNLVKMISNGMNLHLNSLDINFVNTDTLAKINKDHLKHDYATDIITFDYSGEKNNLDGEIFISYQDAFENSKKYHVSVDNELLRLIIHGILHLSGYDDTTVSKRKKMKFVEDEFVDKLNKSTKGLTVRK